MNVTFKCPEVTDHPKLYELTCLCDVPVGENLWSEITFVVIIDTSNPISLLKRESTPNNFDVIKPLSKKCYFSGINNTKFELIRLNETDIFVNDNQFFMRFYVAPDNTMVMSEILEINFVTKPVVNLCFTNGVIQLGPHKAFKWK